LYRYNVNYSQGENNIFGGVFMANVMLKNITKIYDGKVTAVSNFNLDIKDKEFIVLLGPSGCGKSSVLRMIAGLEEITEGELYIDGKLMNEVDTKDRDIAMVFQNYALFPHMTIYENMKFGLDLRKMPKSKWDSRIKEAADILGIEQFLSRKPRELTAELRQKAALACAVVHEPKVILMDELLSNLDANIRVQMRAEIVKLHNRLKTTTIYVTNDQTEAMAMGTRIVVMKNGIIQQVDTPRKLYAHPVNQFVAGFVGSPPMNFIPVTLVRKSNGVFAVFEDNKIKIPEGKVKKLKDSSYVGKEVIMGIRPEDVHDEEIFLHSVEESTIEAYVELVELMGSETYLYLKAGSNNLTARVNPRSTARAGDTIKLALDPNKLYFFDKTTQKTLLNK